MYCLASFLLSDKQNTHFVNDPTSCQASRGSCNYWNYDKFLTLSAWNVLCNESLLNWEIHSKLVCCLHFHNGFSGSPVSKSCLKSLTLDPRKIPKGGVGRCWKYLKVTGCQKSLINSGNSNNLCISPKRRAHRALK